MHVFVIQPKLRLLCCHALDALLRRKVCAGDELDLGAMLSLLSVPEEASRGSARVHAHHSSRLEFSPHRVNHNDVIAEVVSAVVQRVLLKLVTRPRQDVEAAHLRRQPTHRHLFRDRIQAHNLQTKDETMFLEVDGRYFESFFIRQRF